MIPSCGVSIHNLPLGQVDAACLESLRANAVAESRHLDYKERLPGDSDEDKREFLADVTSFANTAGGDLVFGVRERRDADKKATGEPQAIVGLPGVNLDQDKLRLDAMLRDGVEPRIPGVALHTVPRGTDPPCLVIRVPKTPLGVHMVIYKGLSRFYGRGASGRFQLDWGQIRAGFLEAETAQERVRRFRVDRVARVLSGETPIAMGPGPKVIFHALPLTPTEVWPQIVGIGDRDTHRFLPPMAGEPRDWRYNLDGFVVYTLRSELSIQSYVQLFRDAGIEAVSGGILMKDPRRGGFYGAGLEESVIDALSVYQELWRQLNVPGPVLMALTLSGIQGWKMLAGPEPWDDREETFDRDVAVIPEVVVQDPRTPADQALRPLFDLVWNGGGWPKSPSYSDLGVRIRRR